MKNIIYKNGLLIADLHLSDDERYGPGGDYRTRKQPLLLLDRIKELIEEKNIGWIAFLGDIVDVCTTRPIVTHVLNEFLNKLNSFNVPTYFILGQHDIDLNKYDGSIDFSERSNVTVLLENYENLYYAHNTYLLLNDKYSIYLNNYSNPIIYPEKYVDLWLTHCSLGFVKIEELDENGKRKFGFMVAGDIHEKLRYGNCYTVGTPYQHKAFEPQDGVIGFIYEDNDKLNFKRLSSESNKIQFLKFEKQDCILKTNEKDTKNEYKEIKINKLDLMNEIDDKVKELGLEYLHNKIDRSLAPELVNLNFKLKKLEIKNYRSIKEYILDFSTFNKTLLLTGPYGSGKSSIMYAIKDAFIGDAKSISKKINKNSKNCYIKLDLEYENKFYTIIRGKGVFQFFINNEEITANNKKQVQLIMERELPFINYIKYFIPYSGKNLFNQELGVELVEICLHLDLFSYFMEQGKKLKKLEDEKQSFLLADINRKRGELSQCIQFRDELLNTMSDIKRNITIDKQELLAKKEKIKEFKEKIIFYEKTKQKSQNYLNRFSNLSNIETLDVELKEMRLLREQWDVWNKKNQELEMISLNRNRLLKEYNNYKNLLKPELELPLETLEELHEKKLNIEQNNSLITKHNSEIQYKERILNKELEDLNKLINNKEYNCPTCNQKVIVDIKEYEKKKEEVIKELNNLEKPKPYIDFNEIQSKIDAIENNKFNKNINNKINEIIELGKKEKEKIDNFILPEKPNKEFSLPKLLELEDLQKEIIEYNRNKEIVKNCIIKLEEIDKDIKNFIGDINFDYFNKQIENELDKYKLYEEYSQDLERREKLLLNIENNIRELDEKFKQSEKTISDWITYIDLMDYSQLTSLPYNLLNILLTSFNNEKYKIETITTLKNGKEKFSINLKIRSECGNYWIDYLDEASGGQQLLLDLFFYNSISSYIGGIGCFSLDETLNSASVDLYPELNEIISNMKFNNIFIVSHSGFISCFDRNISVSIGEEGYSNYKG